MVLMSFTEAQSLNVAEGSCELEQPFRSERSISPFAASRFRVSRPCGGQGPQRRRPRARRLPIAMESREKEKAWLRRAARAPRGGPASREVDVPAVPAHDDLVRARPRIERDARLVAALGALRVEHLRAGLVVGRSPAHGSATPQEAQKGWGGRRKGPGHPEDPFPFASPRGFYALDQAAGDIPLQGPFHSRKPRRLPEERTCHRPTPAPPPDAAAPAGHANGASAAAILPATFGLLVLRIVVLATELNAGAKDFLIDVRKAWSPGASGIGPCSGKETFLLVGWLANRAGLHFALRQMAIGVSMVLARRRGRPHLAAVLAPLRVSPRRDPTRCPMRTLKAPVSAGRACA